MDVSRSRLDTLTLPLPQISNISKYLGIRIAIDEKQMIEFFLLKNIFCILQVILSCRLYSWC